MRTTVYRGLVVISLSFSVQAYVVYYAYHYGTLRGLLQWDDCAVILRGFENLDLLAHSKSILGFFGAIRHFQIHAPLSDVQTMLGLLFSGGQIWGPYLLNAIWLALTLFAIVKIIHPQNWLLTAAVALFIVVQPVTISALTYIKSDWQGGLLLTGALFVLDAAIDKARPDLRIFAATLLGLSILSKLTAFYFPVLAVCILLLFEWHSVILETCRKFSLSRSNTDNMSKPNFTLMPVDRRTFALCVAIAVFPFLLFFLYKITSTINYIRFAMSDEWDDKLTTLERIRYYSPIGHYSWATWGNLHIFFLSFVGIGLWTAWKCRDLVYPVSLFVLGIIGILFFIPVILSHNSNVSYLATFLGVVMAATLISMGLIARSFPYWGSFAVLAITVLIALPTMLPLQSTAYYSQFAVSGNELRQLAGTYAGIVDMMSDDSLLETPSIVVCYDDVFAPHPNLAIDYFRRTGHLPIVDLVEDLSDVGAISQLSNADFILTIVPMRSQSATIMPGLFPGYPISHDPARADMVVRALSRFNLIGTYPVRAGEIHLYSKHPS